MRDYLLVADTAGQVLALSESARELRASDLEDLSDVLDSLRLPKRAGVASGNVAV